jgi:GAF domain-containing protein
MDATNAAPEDVDDWDPGKAFAELALIAVNAHSPEPTLRRIAELAKQNLSGVKDVSLTVVNEGHPRTVVFTGPLAVDLDERQYELGFGPCVDAANTGQTIVVDTTSNRPPYQEFGRIAARAGVRHVISVGLPLALRTIAGMNIYRSTDTAFPPRFIEHAEVFANYAAVAVNNVTSYANAADELAGLRIAMESRAVIEQAKGMLMARDRCNADEAFDMLRRLSQSHNVKLQQVAQRIVDAMQKL